MKNIGTTAGRRCAAVASLAVLLGATFGTIDAFATSEVDQATIGKKSAEPRRVTTTGVWQSPSGSRQMPIWPGLPPHSEGFHQEAEKVLTADTPAAISGSTSEAVFDVTSPTMTVFPPRGKNIGAAVIVFPGGGFKAVVVTLQGIEICNWLTSKGITCIMSKYRVPKTGHHYEPDCDCGVTPNVPRALQDAQRTIRLVRSKARELNIDPNKIGVMGFSAGGYLAVQTSNIFEPAYAPVDEVDKVSSRPDFAMVFYPGHLCRPGKKLDPGLRVSERAPPTFLLQAWDDPIDDICNSTLYARALDDAGVRSEVHLFAKGGHAFALRRTDDPVKVWPTLVETWLAHVGIL